MKILTTRPKGWSREQWKLHQIEQERHIKGIIKGVYFWASKGILNPDYIGNISGPPVGRKYLVEPQGTYKR